MLIKEAANEGATIQDLETAGEIAAAAYKTAMRSASLTEFQSEAESAFDLIRKEFLLFLDARFRIAVQIIRELSVRIGQSKVLFKRGIDRIGGETGSVSHDFRPF